MIKYAVLVSGSLGISLFIRFFLVFSSSFSWINGFLDDPYANSFCTRQLLIIMHNWGEFSVAISRILPFVFNSISLTSLFLYHPITVLISHELKIPSAFTDGESYEERAAFFQWGWNLQESGCSSCQKGLQVQHRTSNLVALYVCLMRKLREMEGINETFRYWVLSCVFVCLCNALFVHQLLTFYVSFSWLCSDWFWWEMRLFFRAWVRW